MRLSEIFGSLKIKSPAYDPEITGITCLADEAHRGTVFFAMKGANADGHDFIPLALSKGTEAVVGQAPLTEERYFRVENSRRAFAEACGVFLGRPQRRLRILGVTGTNGKTTVTNMLRLAAEASGLRCGLAGTIENIAAGRHIAASQTTPGPEELYPLLKEMADGGDRMCAMEVSSHALAGDRVWGIEFEVGVFTNLTRDHLDFHKTMEAYARAKARLMEQSRISVINADDPWAAYFKGYARSAVTYGIDAPADFAARNIEITSSGVSFDCPIGRVKLPPGGRFSVYNALAAACGALAAGIDAGSVLNGLNTFGGVPGRMELLDTKGKYKIYIDYAHTPDGLEKALSALREFAPRRIITVFGCGGDRDKTKRPLMGEAASRLSDFCVITDDNPRTEDPALIIDDIIKGIEGDRFAVVQGRREAIRLAMGMAEKDDIILLAGKGHETYQIIGTQKLHLDERELVREIEDEENTK